MYLTGCSNFEVKGLTIRNIYLHTYNRNNESGIGVYSTWGIFLGGADYATTVPKLFPWAEVSLHEETYDNADHDRWESECVIYDEGDRFETETFRDWLRSQRFPKLRPYGNRAGEVDDWRLELTLNKLGQAFLIVDQFASDRG